jgi:hypothetical protein
MQRPLKRPFILIVEPSPTFDARVNPSHDHSVVLWNGMYRRFQSRMSVDCDERSDLPAVELSALKLVSIVGSNQRLHVGRATLSLEAS